MASSPRLTGAKSSSLPGRAALCRNGFVKIDRRVLARPPRPDPRGAALRLAGVRLPGRRGRGPRQGVDQGRPPGDLLEPASDRPDGRGGRGGGRGAATGARRRGRAGGPLPGPPGRASRHHPRDRSRRPLGSGGGERERRPGRRRLANHRLPGRARPGGVGGLAADHQRGRHPAGVARRRPHRAHAPAEPDHRPPRALLPVGQAHLRAARARRSLPGAAGGGPDGGARGRAAPRWWPGPACTPASSPTTSRPRPARAGLEPVEAVDLREGPGPVAEATRELVQIAPDSVLVAASREPRLAALLAGLQRRMPQARLFGGSGVLVGDPICQRRRSPAAARGGGGAGAHGSAPHAGCWRGSGPARGCGPQDPRRSGATSPCGWCSTRSRGPRAGAASARRADVVREALAPRAHRSPLGSYAVRPSGAVDGLGLALYRLEGDRFAPVRPLP